MSILAIQQNHFQQYLLKNSDDILAMVVGTDNMSAEKRLKIYSDAYRIRLIEALASNYPMLSLYLGTDNFNTLANKYIDTYPSVFRSIRWYGDKLSLFLHTHYNEYPHLPEFAQFEWSMASAFDEADHPLINIDDIAQVPPDKWADMSFNTHPCVIRLNFKWNSVAIWQSILNNQLVPDASESIEIESWIIWRQDYEVRFCQLPQDEAWATDVLLKGATFGEICEGLCQWNSETDAGNRAASLLKSWVQTGLIINVIFSGEDVNV